MGTARPTASRKPFRKIAPSAASNRSVNPIGCFAQAGSSGFSMRCAVASAADNVMVMMKPVAANPSRHSTRALPRHLGSSSSSTEMLPCPFGLSSATRQYIGSAPKSVRRTRTRVAMGESDAGREKRDSGLVPERREIVDARETHDLPPRGGVNVLCVRPLEISSALEEPLTESPLVPCRKAKRHVSNQISPRTAATARSRSLASTNSPSHFATTTVARQFPITFTIVRAMSMSSSTPRMSVTPSSGKP